MAIEVGDPVELHLLDATVVQGAFAAGNAEAVTLRTDSGAVEVPVVIVAEARVAQRTLDADGLSAELHAWFAALLPPTEGWVPSPVLSGTASALVPGAGQAMHGEWGQFAGYLLVEGVVWGAGAWLLLREGAAPSAVLPLVGVDLVFRTWSVADAVRASRRARR